MIFINYIVTTISEKYTIINSKQTILIPIHPLPHNIRLFNSLSLANDFITLAKFDDYFLVDNPSSESYKLFKRANLKPMKLSQTLSIEILNA